MPSNIDIQKVILALADSKIINLDISLREFVTSPALDRVNSVANLEPWDAICYPWITLIRRSAFDEVTLPAVGRGLASLDVARELKKG